MVPAEKRQSPSLATQSVGSGVEPTEAHSPSSLDIVIREVEVPNDVEVSCAFAEVKVEDVSQVCNTAEQHITPLRHSSPIFGEEKGRGSKVKGSKSEPILKSETWKTMLYGYGQEC